MGAETIVTLIFSALLSLTTSVLLIKVNRIEKKADTRHKENIDREVLLCTHRTDESVLLLEVVQAVQTGKSNGELAKAKDQFVATNRRYEDFVRVQAGMQLARK